MQKNFYVMLAAAALLAGCSESKESPEPAKNEAAVMYEQALNEATEARDKAMQKENEWTGARALMESAAELAGEGKLEEAAALLDQARQQYELAVAQAEREAKDWRNRVIQ